MLLKRRVESNPDASDPQMQILFGLRERMRDTQARGWIEVVPYTHIGCRLDAIERVGL